MKLMIILVLPLFLFSIPAYSQSDADGHRQQIISLDHQDATLWEVLRDLADQTGMNFILDQKIQDRKLTIYLDEVSLPDALSVICEVAQVRYKKTGGDRYRFSADE